jgi:hypothetical protein
MRNAYAFVPAILGALLVAGAQDTLSPPSTASVRGKIVFEGALPPAPPARMNSDPFCATRPQPGNDGLEDVMVYVNPISQMSVPPPGGDALLDRRDCRFIPHTLTLQVGQRLIVRNSDGTIHNAHAWSTINSPFNVSLFGQRLETIQTFSKEETLIRIKDDVHNWESANIGVFLHPYHTVSRLNSAYELPLQPGTYELVAWHDRLGTQKQRFEVKERETAVLNIVFK